MADHHARQGTNIHEADLLRTGGALSVLGVHLSAYLVKGYDCLNSCFRFLGLPVYGCPVEVKKRSSGLKYQVTRYPRLPRAVVLCAEHDMLNAPDHIGFVELPVLAHYLRS